MNLARKPPLVPDSADRKELPGLYGGVGAAISSGPGLNDEFICGLWLRETKNEVN